MNISRKIMETRAESALMGTSFVEGLGKDEPHEGDPEAI